jgi:hypothetical protein
MEQAGTPVAKSKPAMQLNEHFEEPGDIVFRHACARGFEGTVSKRKGSTAPADRAIGSSQRIPLHPVQQPAGEDWGKRG